MAKPDLDLGLAFAQHARDKFVGDEGQVFGKEKRLQRVPLHLLQIGQSDHPHCRSVAVDRHQLHVACANEFGADFCQSDQLLRAKFGLLAGRLRRLKKLHRLVRRRGKPGQAFDDTGVLRLKAAVRAVLDRPQCANRNAAKVKRREQPLSDAGLCLQQGRKRPFGVFHQHDCLAGDHFTARAGLARNRAIAIGRQGSGYGGPTKNTVLAAGFQQADASRIGRCQFHRPFDKLLKHRAGIRADRFCKRGQRAIFGFVVGRAGGPAIKLAGNYDVADVAICIPMLHAQSNARTAIWVQTQLQISKSGMR